MAKTSLIVKSQRPPKYRTRAYRRCGICGRPRAVWSIQATNATDPSVHRINTTAILE